MYHSVIVDAVLLAESALRGNNLNLNRRKLGELDRTVLCCLHSFSFPLISLRRRFQIRNVLGKTTLQVEIHQLMLLLQLPPQVVIPIVCVSVCNTILVCCLRRRRSLFAEHVQLRQHPDVSSHVTQLSTATAVTTPTHSRENSYEKRRDCTRECGSLKPSPIYRRGDSHTCESSFDCSNSIRCKHSPVFGGGEGGGRVGGRGSEREQSSSFIRLGGKQYQNNSLSNSSTPQHHYHHQHQQHHHHHRLNQKNKRSGGGHSSDTKVTSMVLAVTWTFLISQVVYNVLYIYIYIYMYIEYIFYYAPHVEHFDFIVCHS